MKQRKAQGQDVAVRINSVQSAFARDDLAVILTAQTLPTTLLVPKIETKDHIDQLYSWLDESLTSTAGDTKKAMRLILYIESAAGLMRMRRLLKHALTEAEHCGGCYTVDGAVFGSDDFCADIGATRSGEADEVLFARQHFIAALRSVQQPLQAIDLVYIDYKGAC